MLPPTQPVFSPTGRTGSTPPWGSKDRVPIRLGTDETDLEEARHSGGTDTRAMGLVGTLCANSSPRTLPAQGSSKRLRGPEGDSRGRGCHCRTSEQARRRQDTPQRAQQAAEKPGARRCGGVEGSPTLVPERQSEKGRPNSQVAGRIAMSVLFSNKPLTQRSSGHLHL